MLELGGRQFLASRQGQRGVGVPVPVQGFCGLEIVKRVLYICTPNIKIMQFYT